MTAAEIWLRGRTEGVPPALLEAMMLAIPAEDGAVPEALASGAIRLYAEVARGSGAREDALPLLAADALFTHAFEAQAEIAPESIETLAASCQDQLGLIAP